MMISANYVNGLELRIRELTAERNELIQRNAELVAMVAGRDALLNNLSKWIDQLPVPTKSATSWLMRIDGVMKESPNQHLRQIQADAVRDFILWGTLKMDPEFAEFKDSAETYIAQLDDKKAYAARVKAGEV